MHFSLLMMYPEISVKLKGFWIKIWFGSGQQTLNIETEFLYILTNSSKTIFTKLGERSLSYNEQLPT